MRFRLTRRRPDGSTERIEVDEQDALKVFGELGYIPRGEVKSPSVRHELRGRPRFTELLGPLWGDGVLLYEDTATYEANAF